MPSVLDGLNPEQRRAAEAIDGPVLIFAGAGSGKTRTLTHRIAHMVRERDIAAHSILAVTFTNKAAGEMKQRVERLVGAEAGVWVATFHSTCARLLRRYADRVGLQPNFSIIDESDRNSLIRRLLLELHHDPSLHPPRNVGYAISDWKNELLGPSQAAVQAAGLLSPPKKVAAAVYERYEQQLERNNSLDFDDLILRAVRLLERDDEVRTQLGERFRYVMVDEYQDINGAQYELVQRLVSAHRNLCVVGDDDQAIYSWRGARVDIILRFEQDYPDATTVKLERNYRSTESVLEVANALIANNSRRQRKELYTERQGGAAVTLQVTNNEQDEALYVADMVAAGRREGRSWSDHAVLYRTNAQSRPFEEVFGTRGIPFRLIGGVRFYERKEIRDLVAYLRFLHNPADDVSLVRVINEPARGIGTSTVAKLQAFASSHLLTLAQAVEAVAGGEEILSTGPTKKVRAFWEQIRPLWDVIDRLPVVDFLRAVLDQTGYLDALRSEASIEASSRLENLSELLSAVAERSLPPGREGLAAFLEQVALVSDTDDLASGEDAVPLLTLHSAKGLEFPVVFLVGLEERLCPHARSLDNEDAVAEERRLCYVGMTRAEERLYLTRAWRRTVFGQTQASQASRFLSEIPAHLLAGAEQLPRSLVGGSRRELDPHAAATFVRRERRLINVPDRPGDELPQPILRPAPFRDGEKVRHPKHGVGMVVQYVPSTNTLRVVFGHDIMDLDLGYVSVERVEEE